MKKHAHLLALASGIFSFGDAQALSVSRDLVADAGKIVAAMASISAGFRELILKVVNMLDNPKKISAVINTATSRKAGLQPNGSGQAMFVYRLKMR